MGRRADAAASREENFLAERQFAFSNFVSLYCHGIFADKRTRLPYRKKVVCDFSERKSEVLIFFGE